MRVIVGMRTRERACTRTCVCSRVSHHVCVRTSVTDPRSAAPGSDLSDQTRKGLACSSETAVSRGPEVLPSEKQGTSRRPRTSPVKPGLSDPRPSRPPLPPSPPVAAIDTVAEAAAADESGRGRKSLLNTPLLASFRRTRFLRLMRIIGWVCGALTFGSLHLDEGYL